MNKKLITQFILLVVAVAIAGYFIFQALQNKPFEERDLISAREILEDNRSKDHLALQKLEQDVAAIFTEQRVGIIERAPICAASVQRLWSDENEKVNRVEGFVDEITSICYQSSTLYRVVKEKAGTISDEELDEFSREIWNKYFLSADELEAKIVAAVDTFVASVEQNHEGFYLASLQRSGHGLKSARSKLSGLTDLSSLQLSDFIQDQAGYGVGATVASFVAGRTMRNMTSSLSSKLGKSVNVRGKNWKSAVAGAALATVVQMWIHSHSEQELKQGIHIQFDAMEYLIINGSAQQKGLIPVMAELLNQYHKKEQEMVLARLGSSTRQSP